MNKFSIFFTVFLLAVAAGAVGMRVQDITLQDLFGEFNLAQITEIIPENQSSEIQTEVEEPISEIPAEIFAQPEEVAILPETNPSGSEPSLFEEIFGTSDEPESAPAITIEDAPDLKLQIQTALQTQDFEQALTLTENLITVQIPDTDFFSPILIPAIMKLHAFDRAFSLAEKIKSGNPQSALAWNYLGWAALNANHMDTAKNALSQALILDDTLPQIHLNYGDLWLMEGNHTKAKEFYKYAISLDGPDGVITNLAQNQLDKINQLD